MTGKNLNWVVLGCIIGLLAVNAYCGNTPAPGGGGSGNGVTKTVPTGGADIPGPDVNGGNTGPAGGLVYNQATAASASGNNNSGTPSIKLFPDVEPVMCDVQIRYHYLAMYLKAHSSWNFPLYINWGSTPCGEWAPPYPANDFFDESDPITFVELVRKIVVATYASGFPFNDRPALPYNFLPDEIQGDSLWPGLFDPKSTADCKVPAYMDYNSNNTYPYVGGDVYNPNATVHVGNAKLWLEKAKSDLAQMTLISEGFTISGFVARGGYGYAWSGTGTDDTPSQAWLDAESRACDDWIANEEFWRQDVHFGGRMGQKTVDSQCFESSNGDSSYYINYGTYMLSANMYISRDFSNWSPEILGGMGCVINLFQRAKPYGSEAMYVTKFGASETYELCYGNASPGLIYVNPYDNTWDMPDPHLVPNPSCNCDSWEEYTYESNGEIITDRWGYGSKDIAVGWVLAPPPNKIQTSGLGYIKPDFTVTDDMKSSKNNGCSGNSCPNSGKGNHNNSCLSILYSLGKNIKGEGLGGMRIYGLVPSSDLATPLALEIAKNEDVDSPLEIIRNTDQSPRQVRTVAELFDIKIDPQNTYRYTIRRYQLTYVGQGKIDNLYPILAGHEDDWTWEYTIENPDYIPEDGEVWDYNRLLVTETFENNPANAKMFLYNYDELTSTWRLGHNYNPATQLADKWEYVQELDGGQHVIRETLDQNLNVMSRSDAKYMKLAGQYVLLEATFGTDQLQTYSKVYYDDLERDGALYGLLRYSIDISGHWVRYEYNEHGEVNKIIQQVGDLPITADQQQCKVTTALENGQSVTYAGVEISRTYQIYDAPVDGFRTIRNIQCVTPGAGPDDPTNLVTTTKLYYGGDNNDEVHSITYPDGRVYASLSSETVNGDGSKLTTSYSGTPNDPANPNSIIKGNKTETFTDAQGRTVWYKTYDIQSNVLMSYTQNTEFDDYGRVLRSDDMLRGTYSTSSYGCCHLDATTDELGITTTYGYDALDRQETVTRNGITSYTVYDVLDRPLTQSRISSDDQAVTQRTMQYDMINRVTSSTDAAGNITTYTYTTDPQGHQVQTAINPDGSTIVNTYHQDGTLYKSSGSATATSFYEFGTTTAPIENAPTLVYTKVIHMGDNGAMTQWEMTFTDILGRNVCTVYSDDTPNDLTDNPIACLYYDDTPGTAGGRLVKQVDPDGITTLYAYNTDGEQDVTAIDLNANGIIDYSIDRITKSDSMLLTAGTVDNSVPVRRSESYVWTASDLTSTDGTLTSYTESSIDGMQSWSVTLVGGGIELITHTQTTLDRATHTQTTTTTNPDGSYSVSITTDGQLQSTTSYDANDVILTQQTYAYDAHGRQYAVTDLRTAASGSTTYTYNDADQIVAITTVDPDAAPAPGSNGPLTAQTTRFEYDIMGRQTKITLPDGTTQHRAYTLRGQLAKSWGADGYPVEYTYDTQGRRKTLATWKDFNQATGKGTSGKAVTTWNYDPNRGNMIQKLYDDQKGTSYTYTPAGRLHTRTWARGITTTYTHDAAGQLLGVDYSDATQDIVYTYDRLGRRATTIDAAGQTVYAYVDSVNNLVTDMTVATSASSGANAVAGTQVSYAYDSMMRRQAVTASRLVSDVMTSFTTTGYTYDAASRLKSVTDGVNFATYNYLASSGGMIDNVVYAVDTDLLDGQQLPVTNMFTTTKTYDQLGRFVSHQSVRASDSKVLSSYGYTYNQRGQRTQAQMTDGSFWDYQYDNLGQLTGAAKFTSAGKILPGYQYNYQYDQIGNRTKASSGGDAFGLNLRDTTYQSNTLNQYTQINNHPYTNVTGQAHADATVTVQADSTQPIVGGSTTSDGTHVIQTTRTDMPGAASGGDAYFNAEIEVDRTVTSGGGLTSHDRQGVDLTVTAIRNAQGPNGEDAIDTKAITRQVPAATVMLTYDDDGNLTNDDRWTYIWNGENRLIELQPKPIYIAGQILPGTNRLEFTYDSQGRRIEKRVYAYNATSQQHDTLESITRFLYDGWLLIAELTKPADEQLPGGESAGSPLRTYTHGLDLSGSMEGAGGIAGLLFMTTFNPTSHDREGVVAFTYDGNGNVIDLVNIPAPTEETTGTLAKVTATYEYSPFGQLIRATGDAAETNPFMFSTKYTDAETGFCYYGYRYYDSVMGRWLNRDPIEEDGGNNLLSFTTNSSINYLDAIGLLTIPPVYDVPATPTKCAFVKKWITAMANGSVVTTSLTNRQLWNHYLKGNGAPLVLDMFQFDRWGLRDDIIDDIWKDNEARLKIVRRASPCNQWKILAKGITKRYAGLAVPNIMILNYSMKARYVISAFKKCTCSGCCDHVDLELTVHFDAWDTTNFDVGKQVWYLGVTITDALVKACAIGKPFEISATSNQKQYRSFTCEH
jgi:RHS repeat-associated protein